jgi:osmotically-inducible protein OsmY
MKTKFLMLAVAAGAAFLLSPVLTGCNRQPTERSAAEDQEDSRLADQVKATFATSTNFKFPDVRVAVFRKTVQLSGFAISDDQKQAAENLAKEVPGVEAVENKISLQH